MLQPEAGQTATPRPLWDVSPAAPRRRLRTTALLVAQAAVAGMLASVLFFRFPQTWGRSMEPQLHEGDRVLIDTLAYDVRLDRPGEGAKPLMDVPLEAIERGDIVAFRHAAGEGSQLFLKRVVGLPGDVVSASRDAVFIDGKPLSVVSTASERVGQNVGRLPPDEYYMVGDNGPESDDSRMFGPVKKSAIVGRARFVVWPPRDVKTIR